MQHSPLSPLKKIKPKEMVLREGLAREVIISISEIKFTNQRNVYEGLYLNFLYDQDLPGADHNESRSIFKGA